MKNNPIEVTRDTTKEKSKQCCSRLRETEIELLKPYVKRAGNMSTLIRLALNEYIINNPLD